MAWVWLPGLPSFLYKRRILEEVGGLVDKVAKLDYKIDRGSRGRFARMAVFINLEKLLISQILVNDTVHRVEYEVLSAVCFACDRANPSSNVMNPTIKGVGSIFNAHSSLGEEKAENEAVAADLLRVGLTFETRHEAFNRDELSVGKGTSRDVLDPKRHSTVSFKENFIPISSNSSVNVESIGIEKGNSMLNGEAPGGNVVSPAV
ncbi:hypothetical protein Golob_002510, partial [Gossypium lobatum]|nr:hypothetical protein [Gossypium lobatum]